MAISSVPNKSIWDLLIESGLVDEAQCRKWQVEYRRETVGPKADDPHAIAAWLVGRNRLTTYQGKLLLRGESARLVYGPYVLLDRVQAMPFAYAFQAQHRPSGYRVWVQFLGSDLIRSRSQLADVEGWLSRLCSVEHPSVHRWYEYRIEPPYRFLVMEPLTGISLRERLAQGKLTRQQACWIGQQISEGLAQLHGHGIVHGQVRSDQIWIDSSGRAILLLHAVVPHWQTVQINPEQRADYQAPEFLQPGYQPQPLCDVYSLGCVLYEMLTGTVPFPGGTAAEKLRRHATEPIRPLAQWGVPRELERLVTFLMAKNPAVRVHELGDVVRQLELFAEGEAERCPPVGPKQGYDEFRRTVRCASPTPVNPTTAQSGLPAGSLPETGVPGGLPLALPPTAKVPEMAVPLTGNPGPVAPAMPVAMQIAPGATETGRGPVVSSIPVAAVRIPPAGVPAGASPVAYAQPVGNIPVASALPVAAGQPVIPSQGPSPVGVQVPPLVRPLPVSRRRRSQAWKSWLAVALVVGAAVAVAYYGQRYLTEQSAESTSLEQRAEGNASVAPGEPVTSDTRQPEANALPKADGSTPVLSEDDGVSLWASPTSGSPWLFELVPPAPLLVLAVRPSDIEASAEGRRLLKALGPEIEQLVARWPQQESGLAWGDVRQLLVSLHENDSGQFEMAMVAYLREPISREELLARWGNPLAQESDGTPYYRGATWCYFVEPETATVERFAMGNESQIQQVAKQRGKAPTLSVGWQALLNRSDADRAVSLFFETYQLQTKFLRDGQVYYFGESRKLREFLDAFIGDVAQVGWLSAHATDTHSYLELTLVPVVDMDRIKAVEQLRSRIQLWREQAESYVAALQPPPYWARFALRFPMMLKFLASQTRVQIDDNFIVLNAVLPPTALHNLAFGAEMLLASTPGGTITNIGSVPQQQPSGPQTIEELLQQKITVRFDQTSLEFAMRDVALAANDAFPKLPFKFEIVLLGMDMQKDGITKNQSIRDFKMDNASVADILTALVMRGNPDPTVKSPHEPNQKLIWCIGEDPGRAGQKVVFITTRQGAAERKLVLPTVFTQAP